MTWDVHIDMAGLFLIITGSEGCVDPGESAKMVT
jgi:hypothetical protein